MTYPIWVLIYRSCWGKVQSAILLGWIRISRATNGNQNEKTGESHGRSHLITSGYALKLRVSTHIYLSYGMMKCELAMLIRVDVVGPKIQQITEFLCFWLPATCGGAALGAKIGLLLLLLLLPSFNQSLSFLLLQHKHRLA